MLSEGISPRAIESYAPDREMPSSRATSSTVNVSRSFIGSVGAFVVASLICDLLVTHLQSRLRPNRSTRRARNFRDTTHLHPEFVHGRLRTDCHAWHVKDALIVDEPRGERWDLAVDLLTRGEGFVSLGTLLLYRSTSGPVPDHRVHVEIRASSNPERLTTARRAADVERGLAYLEEILRDERFAELTVLYDVVCEYVDDYDTGRVLHATVDREGVISWASGFDPPPS